MAALSVDGTPMPALPNSADQINYNNTTSGLSATTVKGAVDELASEKQDKSDDSLQTTDKTIPGAINELKSGLTDLKYRKVAESVSTGTCGAKLQSLATAYNSLTLAQRLSALLVANDVDIYQPVNCSGHWFKIWVESTGAYASRYGIDGSAYDEAGGAVTDNSSAENGNVFAIWVCE